MNQETGKYIVIVGLIICVTGIIIYLFHNNLRWFGRLPGDVNIQKGNIRIYFPVMTMLVISIILSLLIYMVRKVL